MKLAISIGDLNGIGIEIALRSHKFISKFCKPYYFVHKNLLKNACEKLNLKRPKDFKIVQFLNKKSTNFTQISKNDFIFSTNLNTKFSENFDISPGIIDAKSGKYSFASFKFACEFVNLGFANALLTLPIHKKAWSEAQISYKGHTDALRDFFKQEAIMMLGNKKLFVALFTEHIPLCEVSSRIKISPLCEFLVNFYEQTRFKNIGVLAFNPHASDFGAIGGAEEKEISQAIKIANLYLTLKFCKSEISKSKIKLLDSEKKSNLKDKKSPLNLEKKSNLLENLIKDKNLFSKLEKKVKIKHFFIPNPLVADVAFTPNALKHCNHLVSMSHDLALAPLKALYFDESVNVSLNLPIIRTSVDHGTAFDKAYKGTQISTKSYKKAAKIAIKLAKKRDKIEKNL